MLDAIAPNFPRAETTEAAGKACVHIYRTASLRASVSYVLNQALTAREAAEEYVEKLESEHKFSKVLNLLALLVQKHKY